MNYIVIDKNQYYRKGVYRHFTQDCKCSTSMTARIDVTALKQISDETSTKFYVNFLYILSKALNSREDYRMGYFWEKDELICYDVINPMQYIFHEDTETCTPVYTTYYEDYETFYENAVRDIETAKQPGDYRWVFSSQSVSIVGGRNQGIYFCEVSSSGTDGRCSNSYGEKGH